MGTARRPLPLSRRAIASFTGILPRNTADRLPSVTSLGAITSAPDCLLNSISALDSGWDGISKDRVATCADAGDASATAPIETDASLKVARYAAFFMIINAPNYAADGVEAVGLKGRRVTSGNGRIFLVSDVRRGHFAG
jgi:hypothetical protein